MKQSGKNHGRKNSRRKFLKRLGIGLATTALGAIGLERYVNYEKPYSIWYARNIAPFRGDVFVHKSFVKPTVPSAEDREKLFQSLEDLNTTSRQDIADEHFYKGNTFELLQVSDEIFLEYARRSTQSIRDLFRFVRLEDRIPSVEFHRLMPDTRVDSPKQEHIPFYVAYNCFNAQIVGDFGFNKTRNGKQLRAFVFEGKSFAGGYKTSSEYIFTSNGMQIKEIIFNPVFISAGIDAVKSYETPPAEALHYAVHRARDKLAESLMNEEWRRIGVPDAFPIELLNRMTDKALRYEEGIVHAAVDLFLRKHKKTGISEDYINDAHNEQMQQEPYDLVRPIINLMLREGCAVVISQYLSDPVSIVSKIEKRHG